VSVSSTNSSNEGHLLVAARRLSGRVSCHFSHHKRAGDSRDCIRPPQPSTWTNPSVETAIESSVAAKLPRQNAEFQLCRA